MSEDEERDSFAVPKTKRLRSAHGTQPEQLVEKILRMKIYDSSYFKEHW